MLPKEQAMAITDIIIVSVITLAFLAFAVVLAWGDHQTREIARASRERALTGAHVVPLKPDAPAENKDRAPSEQSHAAAKA